MRYIILLLLLLTASLFAAEFKVISCEEVGNDLTARIYSVKDLNDDKCGVIKVQTDLTGLSFESTIPPTEIKKSAGEYIVYLSPNTKRITIKKEGFMPLQFELPSRVKSEETMVLKLTGTKDLAGDIPVNIIATPAGAILFVDGANKGVTETAKLAAGKHTIRLEKAGFTTIEQEVTVSAEKNLFKFTLTEEDPAKLKISSEPAGAAVYLDGAKIGVTPFTKFYPPGKYKIKIEKEAFETIEEQLTIKLPETVKNYNLTDNSAFLTIKTSPKATVYINDERITNLTNIKLAPQFVEIRVTMPRAKDLSRKIMLKKGERQTIDLMPEIAMGKIQIAVTPDDADLTLTDEDGQSYTAKGSNIFKNMPVGKYELSAKLDGHKIGKASIVLSADQVASKELVLEKGADVGGDFVFVQGGTFSMGSNESDDEKPIHSVTVSDFYIGKYEVTQKEWMAVMGNNPSNFKGDDLPVEKVSWDDCQEFIRKLNAKTGKKYRLPTEAEWEYAARGGNKSNRYKFSGSDNLGSVAWCSENSNSKTHPVGTKQANELGIYDMTGNIWEWCSDWYDAKYYGSSPSTNPQGASSGSDRVFRGGGWSYLASYCRVAFRYLNTPDYRDYFIGFRLAL